MKYILIFLLALVCSVGYAQFPINQYIGAPTTLVTSRGGFKADSSLILPQFPDTIAANRSPYIKTYPGNMIRVFNDIYMRNTTATRWLLVNGGGSGGNNFIDSLRKVNDSVFARKYGVFVYQYTDSSKTIDTTSISNRINTKIDSLYKVGDSVYATKSGVTVFQYLDSSQNILANNGLSFSGDTLQLGGSLVKNTTITGTQKELKLDSIRFQVRDDSLWRRLRITDNGDNGNKENYFGTTIGVQGYNKEHKLIITQDEFSGNIIRAYGYRPENISYIQVDTGIIKIRVPEGNFKIENLESPPLGTMRPLVIDASTKKVHQWTDPYNWNVDTSLYVKYTDTSTMLGNYVNSVNYGLTKSGQTISVDTTKISTLYQTNLKVKYTDTASMLSPYYKAIDTNNLRRVTSVGLTMPSAFTVSNSPITTNGTIGVTGAGLADQYIRGDGTLANFPTNVGGGSSVSYYLNGSVNQGTFGGNTYHQMSRTPVIGTGTNFTLNANGYIANFITDAGDPSLLNIPGGNWDFQIYFSASSSGGSPQFYTELYKYNGTTFTLISSGSVSPQNISFGTFADVYSTTLTVPQTTLSLTDRLAVRIYVLHSGRTITMYTEDNKLAEVHTTFSTGIAALNGLTSQVQYFGTGTSGSDFNISSDSATATHTFNLPTASATKRGALSTTDWSTFNGKLSPSDTATMLSPYLRSNVASATYATISQNNAKLNISDSAAMLSPYLRKIDTASISNRINLKQNLITLTTTGTSGASTFNQSTGALNIPQYTAGNNIYNSDGTLTGNRTVTMGSNTLSFTGNLSVNGLMVGKGIGSVASNTAFGVSALSNASVSGTHNVMLGNEAGFSITTANDNVAVGSQAMRNNISGIRNVAIGRSAFNAGTGGGNVAIGYNALLSGTSGDQSVGIGNSALANTTGSQNVGIGYFAGVYNTTVANQIFLNSLNRTNYSGDQTGSPFYAQQSTTIANQIVTLNGRVGINTISPSSSAGLEISSTTQGFLQPRVTNTQMGNISTPATGLSVFNTSDSAVYIRRGSGAGWQQLANEIFATASLNFPSTSAQNSSDLTISLTGAVDGDAISLGVPNAAVNANSCYTAWVSATNTITVRFNNYSSGAIDPASATFKVTIIK